MRWVTVLALALGCGVTAGCGTRSVNDLLADPGKFRNRPVTVRGTVDQSASVLGKGAYRIVDRDQGLWVVTTGGAPRKLDGQVSERRAVA